MFTLDFTQNITRKLTLIKVNTKMEILVLKQEIVDNILTDQVLFGKVAKALDMKVRTAFDRIKENKPDIATASSLSVIAAHLSEKTGNEVQISELTEQLHTVA